MEFKANTSELLKALNKVNGVVPSKTALPILENILFDLSKNTLSLSATDLEVSMTTSITVTEVKPGKVAVPAKRLIDTLKSLPETTLTFSANESNQITFTTDKGTYKLSGENGSEYPSIPNLKSGFKFEINAQQLGRMISHTLFAVSSDELRPAMMGVLFQLTHSEIKTVATDGHRLVAFTYKKFKSTEDKNFIVPAKALGILTRIIDTAIVPVSTDEKFVSFELNGSTLISRLINENYPNYEAVIPVENNRKMSVPTAELKSAVKRVSLFSNSTTHQIRFSMSDQPLKVSAEDFDQGRSAAENINCVFSGEAIDIGFNANYIQDILEHVDTDEVAFELSAPTRASIVLPSEQKEDEALLMLVMPVRLNS